MSEHDETHYERQVREYRIRSEHSVVDHEDDEGQHEGERKEGVPS